MDENLSNKFYEAMKSLEVKAAFEPLIKYVNKLEERTDKAEAKLREYSKDAEIQKLQAEIDRLNKHALIVFSPQELKEYKEIDKGSDFKMRFISTGIGTCIEVKNRKGKWIDITDVSNW